MSHAHVDEPPQNEGRDERENLDGLPARPTKQGHSESAEPRENGRHPGAGVVDTSGDFDVAIDGTILDALIDETDTPEEVSRKVALVRRTSSYRGPLPDSREFARYKEVEPTAPETILQMAKNSNDAMIRRLDAESESIRVNARIDEKAVPRGQFISGALILAVLALAAVALVLDRVWFGALFGIGGLGMMVMNTLPSVLNRNAPQSPPPSDGAETPSIEK